MKYQYSGVTDFINTAYNNLNEDTIKTIENCHFGAIKLFYSEVEFLLKCSKYVDINECLILYIGAQPGYRLKYIYINIWMN